MKKILLLLAIILSMTTIVSAESTVNVRVNGELVEFDAQPYIDSNNRTLVPVRFISEKLRATVEWKAATRQVIILKDNNTITLAIGSSKVDVNGKTITLDTAASIKDDRTFVPVRFVSEVLGAKVEWDGSTRTVLITTPKAEFILEGNTYVSENAYEDVIRVTKEAHEILSQGDGLLHEFDNTIGDIVQYYYIDKNVNLDDMDQMINMDINFSTTFSPHSSVPEATDYPYSFMFEKVDNTDDVLTYTKQILSSIYRGNKEYTDQAYNIFIRSFNDKIKNSSLNYINKDYEVGNRTISITTLSGQNGIIFRISREGI